jgi:hypothetical protein
MTQLIEAALQATMPMFSATAQNQAVQTHPEGSPLVEGGTEEKLAHTPREPIALLPVLPSSALDELFCRFGFRPNSRANLIRQGLFPRGAALRGRAMSTSLYPTLAVDLIALLSREKGHEDKDKESTLAARLREEINALVDTALFGEVLKSLTKKLPVGQPLNMSALTQLFMPQINLVPAQPGLNQNLSWSFDWFTHLDYQSQLPWYQLSLLQHQLRLLFFGTTPTQPTEEEAPALLEILTGWVEGEGHSPAGYSKVVFSHSAFEGELAYWEEVQLKNQTLDWLGCNWSDAPLARLQATLDQYDSRLVFYLPGLQPPLNHLISAARSDYLEKQAATTPVKIIPGFEQPFDPNNPEDMTELLAELALEETN